MCILKKGERASSERRVAGGTLTAVVLGGTSGALLVVGFPSGTGACWDIATLVAALEGLGVWGTSGTPAGEET